MSSVAPGGLYSSLAGDPDLGEIVDLFVDEMPSRVQALWERYEAADFAGLCRLAHQLKGAAGSYGFEPISPLAASLEAAARECQPDAELRHVLEDLTQLCALVRRGPTP